MTRILAIAMGVLVVLAAGASAQDGGSPAAWQLWHPIPATPVMARMEAFHELLLWIMVGICLLVTVLLAIVILRFNAKRNPTPTRTSHNTVIEVVWTVVPVIILVVIAVPSFRLLYFLEIAEEAEVTVKATGRQWYWDYEYPDLGIQFSSIMIPDEDIRPGQKRLLEVDNRLVLPVGTTVRLLVTGGDVIHSLAVPSFGLKEDAVPGRINEAWVRIDREGVFYGMCSEICGNGHGYMPIAVEAVSRRDFQVWAERAKAEHGIPGFNDKRLAQNAAAE